MEMYRIREAPANPDNLYYIECTTYGSASDVAMSSPIPWLCNALHPSVAILKRYPMRLSWALASSRLESQRKDVKKRVPS
jgi:hypothetical protein